MILGNLRCFARNHSSPRAFSSLMLGALALFALALFPTPAAAQTTCPGTITGNLILSADIVASAGDLNPCITVGGDGLMVNLSGYTIDISALGNAGVAIDTGNTSGTAIVGAGGEIVTAYTATSSTVAAITTASSTNITVTGLKIWNVTSSCTPGDTGSTNQRNLNAGNAMLMSNITGGSINTNDIECYQTGITVSASDIPRKGTGDISNNNFVNNTYNNSAAGTSVASAGLVLDSSSGWTIQNNFASYNGSLDGSFSCVVLDPGCFAAIRLTGTSNGNSVLTNNVYDNFGPGIYTGPSTSRNKIQSNTNIFANAVYDLWDDVPPHSSNNWNKNSCPDGALGSVSPQRCP
jgi:parallel beta-helix repeat protein